MRQPLSYPPEQDRNDPTQLIQGQVYVLKSDGSRLFCLSAIHEINSVSSPAIAEFYDSPGRTFDDGFLEIITCHDGFVRLFRSVWGFNPFRLLGYIVVLDCMTILPFQATDLHRLHTDIKDQ